MEKENLKINGGHFADILGEEVEKLKAALEKRLKELDGTPKKNPLLNLYRSGRLTKELILMEMPKLQNKTSLMPRSERDVYADLINTAVKRTIAEEAREKLEAKKKEKSKGSKK